MYIIVASSEISFFLRFYNYASLGVGGRKKRKKKKRDRENENRIDIRTKRHPGRPREYEETRYGIKLSFLSVRIQFQVAFLRLMPRCRSGWRGKNFHSILLHRYSMPPVIVHVLEYISRNRELFDGCKRPMIVQTGKPI